MDERKKILILEDDISLEPYYRASLNNIFYLNPPYIDWAISVWEARNFLKQKDDYDIIIADLFLSGSLTGLDFLAIDQIKMRKNIKKILVTSSHLNLVTENYDNVLNDVFIIGKPFNTQDLKPALTGS